MQEIRLGTIGTGPIVHSILDGVQSTEGISLEAVYSRSYNKGEKLAREYGIQKVYTELEKLFMDENINFIYIASPNSFHYEQAKRALLHGKNVICEKPLCAKKEQLLELYSLAKQKKLFLVDATPTAFLPNFDLVKKHVADIGRIRLVLCNYSQYSRRYDQVLEGRYPNVFLPDFAGGCLQDINYYNVYFNVALFGKPQKADYYANICGSGVDTSGIMIMKYADFISECTGAKDTWGINSAQIQGEKGYIYIEDGTNGILKVRVVTREIDETFDYQNGQNRWFLEVRKMTELILEEKYDEIYERLETTLTVVETIENARKSAGIVFPGDD